MIKIIVFLLSHFTLLDENTLMIDLVHQFQLGFLKQMDLEKNEKLSTIHEAKIKSSLSAITELQDKEEILDALLEISYLYLEALQSTPEPSRFESDREDILDTIKEAFNIYNDEYKLVKYSNSLINMLSTDSLTFSNIILQSRNLSIPLIPIDLSQILELYYTTFIGSEYRNDDTISHCLSHYDYTCLGEETGKLLTRSKQTLEHLFSSLNTGTTIVSILLAFNNPKSIGNLAYIASLLAKDYLFDNKLFEYFQRIL